MDDRVVRMGGHGLSWYGTCGVTVWELGLIVCACVVVSVLGALVASWGWGLWRLSFTVILDSGSYGHTRTNIQP